MRNLFERRGKAKKVLLLAIGLMFFPVITFAMMSSPDEAKKAEMLKRAYRIQVPFIENLGQVKSKEVGFYARTFGGTVFVEKRGALTYRLPAKDQKGVVIKEIFTEKRIKATGLKPSPTKVNYFIGKDKGNWKTNIPTYESISLGKIYKGVELSLRAYGDNVEKVFTVLPEGDPETIKIRIAGAKGLKANAGGELEVITEPGTVRFTKPLAYQEIGGQKELVEVSYVIYKENTYGFKVGNYDKTLPLVIDPLLASTYLGGSGSDFGIEIAIDDSGNIIVAGVTSSMDFPTTLGAYDIIYNGGETDVFVTKIDPSGSSLVYSTFIGGSDDEHGDVYDMELYKFGMEIDNSGNVYVTSSTRSSDFPTTPGAYDTTFNGGESDVFVTKLNSSGDNLIYSTFLGGSRSDNANGIAIDGNGNAYVAGDTHSSDFPTTSGAFSQTYSGQGDIFVTKIDPSGSNLVYSTYLGGSQWDESTNIAVDASGNAYVIGGGDSTDYPTTSGAFDQSYNGGEQDIYVTKLNSTGSELIYSTFLGGSDKEWPHGLAVGGSGNAYVSGNTHSSDFPVTPGAFDTIFDEDDGGFVTKINSAGSGLSYSTFLSNAGVMKIKVDASENAFVTGCTASSNFPTTPDAFDTTFNGVVDAIVTIINPTGTALVYSSFLGGGAFEYGLGIAIDLSGKIYLTGITDSTDFPTQSPIQPSYGGGMYDAFVSKISSVVLAPVADFSATPTTGTAPLTVNFTDLSTGDITSWEWNFGDGQTSTEQNPTHTYNTPGIYTVSLTVTGPGGTDTKTKIDYITVTAGPLPVPDIKANGSDGPLFVTPSEAVDISISLDPGNMTGEWADWWGILLSSYGTFPLFGFQCPIFELPDTSLFSIPWPVGWYIFLFGLDDVPDGAFELDWYDYVVVVSQPAGAPLENIPNIDDIVKENLMELIGE